MNSELENLESDDLSEDIELNDLSEDIELNALLEELERDSLELDNAFLELDNAFLELDKIFDLQEKIINSERLSSKITRVLDIVCQRNVRTLRIVDLRRFFLLLNRVGFFLFKRNKLRFTLFKLKYLIQVFQSIRHENHVRLIQPKLQSINSIEA